MLSMILKVSGHVQSSTGKHHQGLGADGNLLGLELGDAAEGLGVEVELEHVEHLVVEGTGEGDGMGPLLAAGAEENEGGIVLLGKEGQGAGVLEGVDGVLLVEALGVGLAQRVEILHSILGLRRTVSETAACVYEDMEATYDLAALGATKEKGGLGVLVELGGTLLEGPLGTGCPRLAVMGGGLSAIILYVGWEWSIDVHLAEHFGGITMRQRWWMNGVGIARW